VESLSQPLRDTNSQTVERIVDPVVITNNVLNGTQRGIQIESANNVTISNNIIRNHGARVSMQNNPVRYSRYEGIVIEGTTNGTVEGNQIIGVEGERADASTTVGIIVESHDGIVGLIPSSNVDIAASNTLTNLDSNIEQ
jgi:parallel beta-helix repeat protein